MAEIELNVLTGQCLNRRIDSIEKVRAAVSAWQIRRDNLNARINWHHNRRCQDKTSTALSDIRNVT